MGKCEPSRSVSKSGEAGPQGVLFIFCTRYNQGGVAGTSFIAGPLTRGSGDAVGASFIADCGGRGIRVLSRTFQSI